MVNALDTHFKNTCRVLFGTEVGSLEEFKPYLTEMVDPPIGARCSLSGKTTHLGRPYYHKGARFADLAALGKQEHKIALGINEIKDIDSLLAALGESMYYCGGKNLGTTLNIAQSDTCNDSVDVLNAYNVLGSKRVAYSNGVRESECVFGCQLGGEIAFCARCQIIFFSKRCFETYLTKSCTDMYCSFGCQGCTECMFCFNQASKRFAIGNNELPRDKYMGLKTKLVSEIADELKAKKRFPSVFEIAQKGCV